MPRMSDASLWALALADARPIPYVLLAPPMIWPGMLSEDQLETLPALGGSIMLDAISDALRVIHADRETHVDPFEGIR